MSSIYLMIREHQTTCAGLRRVGIIVNLYIFTFNVTFGRLAACCPEAVAHAAQLLCVVPRCIFLRNVVFFVVFACLRPALSGAGRSNILP